MCILYINSSIVAIPEWVCFYLKEFALNCFIWYKARTSFHHVNVDIVFELYSLQKYRLYLQLQGDHLVRSASRTEAAAGLKHYSDY